jgi:hypothetical protein
MEWAAFVIGSMRSGSTLLRYLLDSHERLACSPESRFITALHDFLDAPYVAVSLSGLGCTSEDLRRNLQQFIDGFLSLYAKQAEKPRWIDKSPNYYQILPFLEKVYAGKVLYVLIVRHPLDNIISLEEAFPNASRHSRDPEIATIVEQWGKGRYGWARYWMDLYDRVHLFRTSTPERTHLVRYEDLVSSPETVMRKVIAFLGEDPVGLHLERAFEKRKGGGLQDQKIRSTSEVHTKSVDRWKSLPEAETHALWSLVANVAGRYGYSGPQ